MCTRSVIFRRLITIAVISSFPLYETVAGIRKIFPLNKFPNTQTFSAVTRRRLSEGFSDDCINDADQHGLYCVLDPSFNCVGFQTDYRKWVIQVDDDTEYMCFPLTCTASDVEYFFSSELTHLNDSARYCSMDCPPIKFDISGYSNDGEMMNISGMYNYANLSYDCAGAAALTEISKCEETGSCPSDVIGLTTCTINYEDSLTYAHLDRTWKGEGKVCLPDQCTNEENLERMEDFFYALLRYYEEYQNGVYLTSEEIRDGYSVDYVCSNNGSESNLSQYVTIFGTITAFLFTVCLCAFCIIRLNRGCFTNPIVAVELYNPRTFVRLQENEQEGDEVAVPIREQYDMTGPEGENDTARGDRDT